LSVFEIGIYFVKIYHYIIWTELNKT